MNGRYSEVAGKERVVSRGKKDEMEDLTPPGHRPHIIYSFACHFGGYTTVDKGRTA